LGRTTLLAIAAVAVLTNSVAGLRGAAAAFEHEHP